VLKSEFKKIIIIIIIMPIILTTLSLLVVPESREGISEISPKYIRGVSLSADMKSEETVAIVAYRS